MIMTQVGHALTGVSIATLALPAHRSCLYWITAVGAFVALAHLPDAPLPWWGHDRHDNGLLRVWTRHRAGQSA